MEASFLSSCPICAAARWSSPRLDCVSLRASSIPSSIRASASAKIASYVRRIRSSSRSSRTLPVLRQASGPLRGG